MKITGGTLRGRRLKVPSKGVRPTSDMAREAIFSMIAPWVGNAQVIDVFAGSGSLGLEAWSRGAAAVTFVEQHRNGMKMLKDNVRELAGDHEELQCICSDGLKFLSQNRWGLSADLIFADPPYDQHICWLENTLRAVQEGSILEPNGRLIFELGKKDPDEIPEGWTCLRDKSYGGTRVLVMALVAETETETETEAEAETDADAVNGSEEEE